MRIVRLPGIHHDSNIVLVIGTLGCVIIDSGTSWYQALQLERIQGILADHDDENSVVDRILLTVLSSCGEVNGVDGHPRDYRMVTQRTTHGSLGAQNVVRKHRHVRLAGGVNRDR